MADQLYDGGVGDEVGQVWLIGGLEVLLTLLEVAVEEMQVWIVERALLLFAPPEGENGLLKGYPAEACLAIGGWGGTVLPKLDPLF